MPATPQSQAVALANQALSLDAQIANLLEQVNQFLLQWNDCGAAAVLNALPSAAVNADGSLGTADGTPNTAHPIDTRLVTGLNRAISAGDLSALVTYPFASFQAMCNGQATVAVPAMRQLINKATGG